MPAELASFILALGIIGSSIYLVRVLFHFSIKTTPRALTQLISHSLEHQRYLELSTSLQTTFNDLDRLASKQARLEADLAITSDASEQNSIQLQLQEVTKEIKQVSSSLKTEQKKLENEARTFTTEVMKDLAPVLSDISPPSSSNFFLEYMTVIVVIMSVVILAILGILSGEQVSPLVAAIAGYVLGRTGGMPNTVKNQT